MPPPTTPRFTDSPDARSKTITTAEGSETHGVLNRHSPNNPAYQIGVSEDKGTRRTMEDAHSFVVDFAGVRGQGFFAVFDGHAGKHAAEWCGGNFHEYLLEALKSSTSMPIPDVFNQTFHDVDARLSRMCEESEGKIHSGCTAVTAFLRIEELDGGQTFLSSSDGAGSHGDRTVITPPPSTRRVLYVANAGDARGVLCRDGQAVRLTYDHKGSDKQEAKRITDAGGFVMSGRVNGVLAVTRSLGDSSMKDFVVGSPYTTETELCDDDEFLILACDGLWDVAADQAAVDLIRDIRDAQYASETLLKHALGQHTTDNVTVLVVRFKTSNTWT